MSTTKSAVLSHFFSHTCTFVEKIEKSMNLLIVCKLCPALLAQLLIQKSMRLNLNVSNPSNHSTVLQARL